ncbi:MAG: hypothetical protein SFU25_03460 [Candidatus Caenarcaniphilales bacterium]|nr:hypothetical protein [Candidatus Caenarcaniphilales bacterium]
MTTTSPINPRTSNQVTPLNQNNRLDPNQAPVTERGDSLVLTQHVATSNAKSMVDRITELNEVLNRSTPILQQHLQQYSQNLTTVYARRDNLLQVALGAIGSNSPVLIGGFLNKIKEKEETNKIAEALHAKDQVTPENQGNFNTYNPETRRSDGQTPEFLTDKYRPIRELIEKLIGEEVKSDMEDADLLQKLNAANDRIQKTKRQINSDVINASQLVKFNGQFYDFKGILKQTVEGKVPEGLIPNTEIAALKLGEPLLFNGTNPDQNLQNAQQTLGSSNSARPLWLSEALNVLMLGRSPYTPNLNAEAKAFIDPAKEEVFKFIDSINANQNNWDLLSMRETFILEYRELLNKGDTSDAHYKKILETAWKIQILTKSETLIGNLVKFDNNLTPEQTADLEKSLGVEAGSGSTTANALTDDSSKAYSEVTAVWEKINSIEEDFRKSIVNAAPQGLYDLIEDLYEGFITTENTNDPIIAIERAIRGKNENFIFQTAVNNKIQQVAQLISSPDRRASTSGDPNNPRQDNDINIGYILAGSNQLVAELSEKRLGLVNSLSEQGLQILSKGAEYINKAGQLAFSGGGGRG